jgi:plasmid replication initiation protein
MKKSSKMSTSIEDFQSNADYIILDNPLSNPKFVRKISKTETKSIKEIYTPKLFIEVVSRLKHEDINGLSKNETISFELNIKDFLKEIDVNDKHGYGYLVDSVDSLQTTQLKWSENKTEYSASIITKMIHIKGTGKIEIFIDSDLAKRLLDVKSKENFSFIKQNFFKLQNGQAIRLYQFFKSWQNKGIYETGLERFKEQFGYNTSGYKLFSKFKEKVLEPAKKEINDKTDIIISYDRVGDNLDGERPRVRGLIFYIKPKEKVKVLTSGEHKGERHATEISQPQEEIKIESEKKIEKNIDKPNEAQILHLGQLAKLDLADIQNLIVISGNIRAWEILKSFNEISKLQKINNPLGYIHKSKNDLGVGLWGKEKGKAEKIQQEKSEKEKKFFIEDLNKSYKKRKEDFFIKKYNDCTEEQKMILFETIKEEAGDNRGLYGYWIKDNQLKEAGIFKAGEMIAEQQNEGRTYRQKAYRKTVFEKYGYTIDFDENDQIILP